jgi:hypothetical protein
MNDVKKVGWAESVERMGERLAYSVLVKGKRSPGRSRHRREDDNELYVRVCQTLSQRVKVA